MAAKKKQTPNIEEELRDAVKRTGGKYLSEDEKMELAQNETPLTFSSIKTTTSQYGERWELELTLDDKERAMSIPAHEDRDEMMKKLQRLCKKNGSVGPLVLQVREAPNGHRWYWFAVGK